jgi:signal transduction histidine kinase
MQFEKQFVLRDGRHIPVLVTASLSGKRHSGMAFLMDLTERKRTEQTLRDLSARLIHGQEEERTRIARELHDDIGQRMALISIELEQLSQLTKESSQEQQSLILKLSQQAREITTDVQHISHELHSPKLEHLGLVSAVKALCRDFSQHRKMRIEVNAQADFTSIPSDLAVCLYRVVQEALQNVIKHSHSPEARVDLHAYPDHIDIGIRDSGIGFDPDSPMARAGLGLVSMRERLRLVQGTLVIESRPGQGTSIRIRVPLEP